MLVQLRKSLDALYASLDKYQSAYEHAREMGDFANAMKYIDIVLRIDDEIIALEAQNA